MRSVLVLAVLAILLVSSTAMADSITVYTNRAAWEAAVGTWQTENFDSLSPGSFSAGLNSAGAIDVRIVGDPGLNALGDSSSPYDLNGTVFYVGEMDLSPPDQGTPSLVFAQPIYAFGADWFSSASNADLNVTMVAGGTTVSFLNYLGDPGDGFLGITSDTPFTEATFGIDGISNEVFGMDDLSFAVIPEPAVAWLGFALLGAAGLVRRWRRRR